MFGRLFSSGSSSSANAGMAGDNQTRELKDLIQSMTKALVDEPEKIQIDEVDRDSDLVSFELRVSKTDLGKVIGKKGRTASAMRTILAAASRKYKLGADLKIVE